MIFQKQAFRHRPEQGEYGDCHRTAIACILDLPRDDVPNFAVHFSDYDAWERMECDWLAGQGLAKVQLAFDCELNWLLGSMKNMNPNAHYILGGTSRNGTGHSVVGLGGEIVWDPSLDDTGIVGPMEDGYYWVTFLVPLVTMRRAA